MMIPTEIYIHTEVLKNGKWEPDMVDDEENYLDYPVWAARDDYDLFLFLTGLELEGVNSQVPLKVDPLEKPRGLPADINKILKKVTDDVSGLNHSWFTLEEVKKGIEREEKRYEPGSVSLFPDFSDFLRDVKKDYTEFSDSEIRIVFWLD